MFQIYVQQSALLLLVCGGIPLLVSAVLGLCVTVVQASMQLQEQTVSYLIKLGATVVVFAVGGNFFVAQCVTFTQNLLASIESIGHM